MEQKAHSWQVSKIHARTTGSRVGALSGSCDWEEPVLRVGKSPHIVKILPPTHNYTYLAHGLNTKAKITFLNVLFP